MIPGPRLCTAALCLSAGQGGSSYASSGNFLPVVTPTFYSHAKRPDAICVLEIGEFEYLRVSSARDLVHVMTSESCYLLTDRFILNCANFAPIHCDSNDYKKKRPNTTFYRNSIQQNCFTNTDRANSKDNQFLMKKDTNIIPMAFPIFNFTVCNFRNCFEKFIFYTEFLSPSSWRL